MEDTSGLHEVSVIWLTPSIDLIDLGSINVRKKPLKYVNSLIMGKIVSPLYWGTPLAFDNSTHVIILSTSSGARTLSSMLAEP